MDRRSFDRAAAQYQDMVYRLALHYFASPSDAEDAMQEVFLKLYTSKKPFEGEEHLRRWLLRVTINVCKDTLKSPWHRRRVPLEELPAPPSFRTEDQLALYQAVMALPETYRTVLNLFYYEELTAREIGQILGLGTSAVTTRLSRARRLLKEQLKEVWQDAD